MTKIINLCQLPESEQEAIETDKSLWIEAVNLLIRNLKLKQKGFVEQYLNDLSADKREDFERRLFVVKQNRRNRRK